MSALVMQTSIRSDIGRRKDNEDAAFASPRLVAVADGVGGAAAGEVASHLAIQKMMDLDKRRLIGPLDRELSDAIADANDVIAFAIDYDARHTGMATTLTAVALANSGDYLVSNVGDSRTYLLRAGQLQRLTRDDSLVQELIDQGELTEQDAHRHPLRSLVLKALDGAVRPTSPPRVVAAQADDRLLLCSDGVSDYLCDDEITELLSISDLDHAAQLMVEAASTRGSRDNITAIVADVCADREVEEGWLNALPAPADRAR